MKGEGRMPMACAILCVSSVCEFRGGKEALIGFAESTSAAEEEEG